MADLLNTDPEETTTTTKNRTIITFHFYLWRLGYGEDSAAGLDGQMNCGRSL